MSETGLQRGGGALRVLKGEGHEDGAGDKGRRERVVIAGVSKRALRSDGSAAAVDRARACAVWAS